MFPVFQQAKPLQHVLLSVCVFSGGVSLEKCNWSLIGQATGDIVKEVIEVDKLNEGSISVAAGKQDELSCATLGLKIKFNSIQLE